MLGPLQEFSGEDQDQIRCVSHLLRQRGSRGCSYDLCETMETDMKGVWCETGRMDHTVYGIDIVGRVHRQEITVDKDETELSMVKAEYGL